MSSGPQSSMSLWQSLAVHADQGTLFLSSDAARACSEACSEYINKLVRHQDKAEDLASISGWGDFQSGQTLREIYAAKAVGGPNNMVDVLQSHIDVVKEMQIVFAKFFTDTAAHDQQNAADIGKNVPR